MTVTRSTNRGDTRKVLYQKPMSLSPWAKNAGMSDGSGSVWISMKPKKIIDQYSKGAGTTITQELNTEFLFLAPLVLNENIVHHWEAYESVASRIAQKARSAIKLANETAAFAKVFKTAIDGNFETSIGKEGTSIEEASRSIYNTIPGSKIPSIKIDTPMYYSNSDRRQIALEFQLFNETGKSEDFIKPIQELMKMSSPDLVSDINIEFPYMWSIKTLPIPFLNYTTCALTAVQPIWQSPYVNHLPSSCALTLTFMDLSPLYAGTIEFGSIVNVIQGRTGALRSQDVESTMKMSATTGLSRQQMQSGV